MINPNPTTDFPNTIRQACQNLSMLFYDYDTERYFVDEDAGDVIGAFGPCEKGNQTYRRLAWLCLFVARRAIPCWQLYCDERQPQDTVRLISEHLLNGALEPDWEFAMKPAVPSFMGERIVDCRECDTSEAARATAYAAKFVVSGDPYDARLCLDSALGAFDQSPLGEADHFQEWLTDFAAPIAYAEREITLDEQTAYRTYQADEVAWYSDMSEVLKALSRFKNVDTTRTIIAAALEQLLGFTKKEYALKLLLNVFERWPDEDELPALGKGAQLVEQLPEEGYDTDLVYSLRAKPSVFTIMIVDRLLSVGKRELHQISLTELLHEVATSKRASSKVQLAAQQTIEKFNR